MKVIFRTNLDNYQTNCFPDDIFDIPPRKGESVEVTKVFLKYFRDKKLPTQLEVMNVTWTEEGVICELWYRDFDIKHAKINNINLF